MKFVFISSVLLFCTFSSFCQSNIQRDSILTDYLDLINSDYLLNNLSVIASDSLEGRETGRKGQKMAAKFIVESLKSYGIEGGGDSLDYFQRYKLYQNSYDKSVLNIDGDTLLPWRDFYSFSTIYDTKIEGTTMIFLGYGIDDETYSDYVDMNCTGCLGVILSGEPTKNGISILSGSEKPSNWSAQLSLKIKAAEKNGLSGLLVINESFEDNLPRVKYYQQQSRPSLHSYERDSIPVINTSVDFFQKYFSKESIVKLKSKLSNGKDHNIKKRKLTWSFNFYGAEKVMYSENVLGIIPGLVKPEQFVFVSAHYDHLGIVDGKIYNGADDDGSGTAALLEISRIFGLANDSLNGPNRSVVFLFVSGEEKGLLGSEYYTEHPLMPLEGTVVDLNIDMVGRRDTEHLEDTTKYIYLIGADKLSSELNDISEAVNDAYTQFQLDYTYNDDEHPSRLYYRSDHYNFAKKGIPVIFYFKGLHEDYHQPSDDVERIDFENLKEVTKLVFSTSWFIANKPERLKVD